MTFSEYWWHKLESPKTERCCYPSCIRSWSEMGRCQATNGARKKQTDRRVPAEHPCYIQEHAEQGNSAHIYQLTNFYSKESKWSDSAASDSPSWGNSNMREIWRGGSRGGSGGHWGGNHPDSNQTWGPHGNSQR